MVTIWGWCLVFVIAGQQPIVFDYKTEAALRRLENSGERAARRRIGAVLVCADPPEKTAKTKPRKRRKAKRR
jgi:hypothetical protein